MSIVRDVMDAMGDALATLPACNQVWPRMNLEPNEPCIDIYPWLDGLEEPDERGFGSVGAFVFTVRARVGVTDHDAGQDILLDWMDPTNPYGVAALLEDDQTLGGVASSIEVGPVSGYVQFVDTNGLVSRIGAQWRVRVLPAHS